MLLHQNQRLAAILNSIQRPQCLRFNALKPPAPRIAPPLGRPRPAFESNSNSARNLASVLLPPGGRLPVPAPPPEGPRCLLHRLRPWPPPGPPQPPPAPDGASGAASCAASGRAAVPPAPTAGHASTETPSRSAPAARVLRSDPFPDPSVRAGSRQVGRAEQPHRSPGPADREERGNAGADSGGPAEGARSQHQVHRAQDRQQIAAGVRKCPPAFTAGQTQQGGVWWIREGPR